MPATRPAIWPSIGRLRRLAEILGCSVEALLAFKRGARAAAPAARRGSAGASA